jgi:hypothetical protein
MNIADINKYKKFVENGIYENGILGKLADRYSKQNSEAISTLDIIFNSNRANIIYKNNIPYKCIVDYGSLPSKNNLSNSRLIFYRELWTRRNDGIKAGDIVEFTHNSNENRETYLILKTIDTRENYDLSIMQVTNGVLKWLNSQGIIKESPFVLKLNPSVYPLDKDKVMVLPVEQRVIFIQSNEDTRKIIKGQRFIFDERAWKVIGINRLQDGLIELTLEEDAINPSVDNEELRICNYYGNVASYDVTILNGDTINLTMGDTLQLIVQVKNNQDLVPSPLVTFYSSDESIAIVDQSGIVTPINKGVVTITALYENAQDSIQINITEQMVNNYTIEIIGNAEIKKGMTQTYSVRFYNNGKEIFDQAVFTLTSDDGVTPTQLATIESMNNNSCVIRAGKQIGYIQLHVKNNNGLIYGVKEIRIKPLY